MKILVIDNYDSFTFNLVQLIGHFTKNITVKRNDKITLDEINDMNPDKIVISPGPGTPNDSGISLNIWENYSLFWESALDIRESVTFSEER
jgi:anthranilate/para-aminobenzoate synthase component II